MCERSNSGDVLLSTKNIFLHYAKMILLQIIAQMHFSVS